MVELPPSERFRARLLDAFVLRAPELGWTEAAFKAASRDAGLSEGEALLACPRGAIDLAGAFAARADEAMLAALSDMALHNMRIRDKVTAAVRSRLEAQFAYKDAARAMSRALARPDRHPQAGRMLWRTADQIWRALGDTSTDENYYSKRAILSGVLASTYARWFADDSEGHDETWRFLEARIENVMQFEKVKAKLKPLSGFGQSAAEFAARMRYGRG